MAEVIDIHPVRFNYSQSCSLRDGKYRQIVQSGDITHFQLGLDICPPENNLISDPVFALPAVWLTTNPISAYVDTVNGYGVKVPTGSGELYQPCFVANGVHVMLTFDVVVTAGELLVTAGTAYSETFTKSGQYERWFDAQSLAILQFSGDAVAAWTVTSVGLYAVNTNFNFRIVDSDDVVIRTLTPQTDPSSFGVVRQWLTMWYDWTDDTGAALPDGCYRIEVADPCECSQLGFVAEDFYTVKNQWQITGGWQIQLGTATYQGSSAVATIANALCVGTQYSLTFTVAGMSPGDSIRFRLGLTFSATITSDGTYNLDGVLATSTTDFSMFGLGAGTFTVTGLKVRRRGGPLFGLVSNLFNLRQDWGCSYMVSVCCDQDNLQAGYGDTDFSPRVRLLAEYGQGQHPAKSEAYKDSYGVKSAYFYDGDKYRNFTYSSAEYIHDFMAHLRGYDHAYVDDVEVFVEDEEPPTITWQKRYDIGERTFALSLKQTRITKRRRSDLDLGCSTLGPILGVDGGSGSGSGGGFGGEIVTETNEPIGTG